MKTKKYSSYEQIELELKILKIEKELSYQKVVWNVQKINERLTVSNIFREFLGSYKSILSNSYGVILSRTIPIILKWLIKNKRGN